MRRRKRPPHDAALDSDIAIPVPSTLEDVRDLPGHCGWAVGVIELDIGLFDETIERVNITLSRRVLRRLDAMAKAEHQSRGGLISRLTLIDRKSSTEIR